ncbi:MOSC domain-containing protein [Actinomycetospora sp. TBRC 11914]|uniref:MOSC domain-containing protein n=1 Tax=Actinomycetospora sp. TBRC 11914 TaxID=2729387 RepID=UPI00145F1C37|nr:MOSC domain-containing protein [Actinomycetospora sp. TBRC 11914]NMO88945.1 MOSC domain-containing protein [Actinomycetospora sp. TBRC 11914]
MAELPVVLTVAVGVPVEMDGPKDRRTLTAYGKTPVAGRVAVLADHLAGDRQADRENHGGPHKAVYAYADEDVAWWRRELDRPVATQTFGQNLTTAGLDLRAAVVGEHWRIGTAEFEVAQPRIPCFKLGLFADDPTMPRRFVAAVRPGAYLRVVRTGHVAAGDPVEVVDRPAHGVTLAEVFTVYHHERARAATLLDVPELAPMYHRWARERLARSHTR